MSDTDPGPRVERRRRPRVLLLAFVQSMLDIVVFAGVALLVLSLSNAQIPVPARMADWVESWLNADLESGRVELGRTSLVLDPGQAPQVLMEDVSLYGGDEAEIIRLNAVRMRLAPRQLLQGIALPKEIRISGAQVTARRGDNGEFALSLGTDLGTNGSLVGVLGDLDQVLDLGPLAQVSSLVADNLTITVEDGRMDRRWRIDDGRLMMQRAQDGLELEVMADLFNGTGKSTSTVIRLRSDPGSPYARLTASVENAAMADIALQSPMLAFLSAVDAPVSGMVTANLGGQGEVADVSGSLVVGQGVLRTGVDSPPVRFGGGRLEADYDPDTQTLRFSRLEVDSDFVTAVAGGTAILQEFEGRTPGALVGQFALSEISLHPENLYAEPLRFNAGTVDFRARLAPFRIDIGQMTLQDTDWRMTGKGRVIAEDAGWDVAVDLSLDTLPLDRLWALWPVSAAPEIRDWFGGNLTAGEISDLNGAIRISAGQPPTVAMSCHFSDVAMGPSGPIPAISGVGGYLSLHDGSFMAVIEKGAVIPPMGGGIAIAGSTLAAGDVLSQDRQAKIAILTESTIRSVLSLLDLPPLELLASTDLEADLAEGHARLRTELTFDPAGGTASIGPSFRITGQLLDVVTDTLVKDRRLEAQVLEVRADADGIEIGGEGHLGLVPVKATWSQGFGPGNRGKSRVEGTAELSQRFLDEFGIELPPASVNGAGVARIVVDMVGDGSPAFDLESDLTGVELRLRALGWSKSPDRPGTLKATGRLGERAALDHLGIEAPGLLAQGEVEFAPGLKLARARFDRVAVGGWLDGPVTLIGRDSGLPPAVAVNGGTIDLRSAKLDMRGDGRSGPMTLALDRLVVSDTISLLDLKGEFATNRGLEGSFTASINGRAPVRGVVSPTQSGAAIRIVSDQAGAVLEELGLFRNARGGKVEISLVPTGERGVYDGRMQVSSVQIIDAPTVTELLSAMSVVGLLDQLSSGGITMSRINADFQLSPGYLVLHPSSAVGPSLGVSLEGVYDMKNRNLDLQGVISPVYFLNAIGQLFTRGGEGLFGFNFQMTGDTRNPRVSVNPLSILTPGMFREIFRAPPPSLPQ